MTVDKESEAGAWKRELERHPWGYGQKPNDPIKESLAEIRHRGLWRQADILQAEIEGLRAEIEKTIK